MQNTRLENGRRVWQALWEFRHPDIECFTAQVSTTESRLHVQSAVPAHANVNEAPNIAKPKRRFHARASARVHTLHGVSRLDLSQK